MSGGDAAENVVEPAGFDGEVPQYEALCLSPAGDRAHQRESRFARVAQRRGLGQGGEFLVALDELH